MAAGDISIKFAAEGDNTLKTAIQAIDQQLKALNEGVKASEEAMKGMTDAEAETAEKNKLLAASIDANKDKLSLLGKQYEEAQQKLSKLADEMEKAKQSGDPAAIDRATNAYNRQSTEVAKLQTAMNRTQADIAKASNAMEDGGNKTDGFREKLAQLGDTMNIKLAGEALANITAGIEKFGRMCVDAGKYIWDMASNSSTMADDLITLSVKTGMGTDKLQEYAYAARFVDTELSTVTGSMVKLEKNMSSTSEQTVAAFQRLGVSVTDSKGKMRDSEQVFWELINALGKVKNETERDQLAMQIFGKSAQDLNPLIKAGSDAWFQYADEARKAGLVVSGEGVSALGSFNDSLQRMDATFEAVKNQLMAGLAPAFAVVADAVTDAAQKFTAWIQTAEAQAYLQQLAQLVSDLAQAFLANLGPAIDRAIEIFRGIGDALSFAAQNFDGIVTAIQTVVTVFLALKTAMAALNIIALVTNPVGLMVTAITAAIAAVALLVTNFDRVREGARLFWQDLQNLGAQLGTVFLDLSGKVQGVFTQIDGVVRGAIENIKGSFGPVGQIIGAAFESAWNAVTATWNNAGAYFAAVWETIKAVFGAVGDVLSGNFSGAWSRIKGIVGTWKNYFKQVYDGIVSIFRPFATVITGFFSSAWKGVQSAWSSVTSFFTGVGNNIVSAISGAISSLPGKAIGWARDMMEGFGNAITEFMSFVTSPIKNLADTIASFLHFTRPDKGPLREYESWMPHMVEGMARTLTASSPILERAAEQLAAGLAKNAGSMTYSAAGAYPAAGEFHDNRPIVIKLNDREFGRAVRGYA